MLVIMTGAIAFCGISLLSDQEEVLQVPVALVVEDTSGGMDYAIRFLSDMESTKNSFSFQIMTEDAAMQSLDTGSVAAVMLLPPQVLSGILDGTNEHVQVILSQQNVLSAILLQELSRAGAKTLASAQAGTYAMTELFLNQNLSSFLNDAYSELDLRNLQYALVRADLFQTIHVNATGTSSVQTHYIASAVLFVLLLSGMTLLAFYHKPHAALRLKLRSARIGMLTETLSRYLSILTIYILFYLIPVLLLPLFPGISPATLLGSSLLWQLALLVFCITTYFFFIFELAGSPAGGMLLLFLGSLLLMLASGCFVPLAFFPAVIRTHADLLPTTAMMEQLSHMVSYLTQTASAAYQASGTQTLAAWSLIFLFLGFLSAHVRRKQP